MNHYFDDIIHVMKSSLSKVDEEVFHNLIEHSKQTLLSGNQIIVSGLGKNVPVCEKFVGTMMSLGMRAFYLNTNSAVHGDLGVVHNGDLVIILTKSGETVESVYLVEQLKQRNVDLWLLTFNRDSALAKELKHSLILELEHEGDAWNLVPNYSTILNLIILQELAMCLSKELDIPLEVFKQNHPGGHIGMMLHK